MKEISLIMIYLIHLPFNKISINRNFDLHYLPFEVRNKNNIDCFNNKKF